MTSIRLSLILERFSYPITEEQAWGICYLTASELKSIPGPWIYTPDNILKANTLSEFSIRFPMEAVLFNRSGELQLDSKVISSRFATSDSGASCFSTTDSDSDGSSILGSNSLASNATEYDLITPLAVLLYEVLDYRLEDSEERELSDEIANLIEVMLDSGREAPSVDSPSFGDGEACEMSFDFQTQNVDALKCFPTTTSPRHCAKTPDHIFSLNDVIHRCRSHYFETKEHSGDTLQSHYMSVCKEMVEEYFSCNLNLDNYNFNEELKSWDNIVHSINSNEYILKSSNTFPRMEKRELANIPELSDLDILQTQIKNYSKNTMRHVETNSHQKLAKKSDPITEMLDHIKYRKYSLRPLEDRLMNEQEPVTRPSTPHEMLMEEIHQPPPLKRVPPEMRRRYTLDLHNIKHMKKYTVPKRYYPPKTECLDEYDIEGKERQAIVHGRSVSLPYVKGNNFKVQMVPIQKEYERDSNSSESTDSPPTGLSRRSSPINYQIDHFSSLDDLTTEKECYYPRSLSADLLDLPSADITRSNSRETMILNYADSSNGDSSENQSTYGDIFHVNLSPFMGSGFYSMDSSRSLGSNKGRRHRRRQHANLSRPSTSTMFEYTPDGMSSPLFVSGVSQLQELSHHRHNWVQSQLHELAKEHPLLYEYIMLGKMCHVCYAKFSWKKWGTSCKLCKTKICSNCKTTISVPATFFGCSDIEVNAVQKKKNGNKKFLVCQNCDLFLRGQLGETLFAN